MKFKVDENLPVELSALLSASGYDSCTVHEQEMSGDDDERLYKVCNREKRILITLDKDFADIRTYPPGQHCGIIVIRIFNQSKHNVIKIFFYEKTIPLYLMLYPSVPFSFLP